MGRSPSVRGPGLLLSAGRRFFPGPRPWAALAKHSRVSAAELSVLVLGALLLAFHLKKKKSFPALHKKSEFVAGQIVPRFLSGSVRTPVPRRRRRRLSSALCPSLCPYDTLWIIPRRLRAAGPGGEAAIPRRVSVSQGDVL